MRDEGDKWIQREQLWKEGCCRGKWDKRLLRAETDGGGRRVRGEGQSKGNRMRTGQSVLVLFLRRRRVFAVSCRRLGLVGGRGGGERINGDELILQRAEISRRLPSFSPLSLVRFLLSFFPSQPAFILPPRALAAALNCLSLELYGSLSQAGAKPGVQTETGNFYFPLTENCFSAWNRSFLRRQSRA